MDLYGLVGLSSTSASFYVTGENDENLFQVRRGKKNVVIIVDAGGKELYKVKGNSNVGIPIEDIGTEVDIETVSRQGASSYASKSFSFYKNTIFSRSSRDGEKKALARAGSNKEEIRILKEYENKAILLAFYMAVHRHENILKEAREGANNSDSMCCCTIV